MPTTREGALGDQLTVHASRMQVKVNPGIQNASGFTFLRSWAKEAQDLPCAKCSAPFCNKSSERLCCGNRL